MKFKSIPSDTQRIRNAEFFTRQEVGVLKRLALIILFGLLTTVAGCGTLMERGEQSKSYGQSGYYYLGVQYDWRLLTLKGRGGYDYTPMFCYLSVVCPFATLLSMPADFVVDTVMLYSDHQNKLAWERELNSYFRDKYCRNEGGPDEAELRSRDLDVSFCSGGSNYGL